MRLMRSVLLMLLLASAVRADTVTSSATGLSIGKSANEWVKTGSSTANWTLPPIDGNKGKPAGGFLFLNRGSTTLTLTGDDTGQVWTTSAVNSTTVPANSWARLVNDGTYWVVSGQGLGTTDINTSAKLKTILTDETGSGGAAVFATSPTLTTPTIAGATMTGNLVFTDNSFDIGASAATRPRSYYGAQNITIGPGDGNTLMTFNRTSTTNFGRFAWFLSGTEQWALGVRGDESGAETLSLTGHTSDSNPLVMRVRRGSATNCYQLDLSNGTATAPHMAVVGATSKALTESSATNFVQIAVASGNHTSGTIHYTIHADNGTDFQCRTGSVHFSIVNKAGTETAALGTAINESVAVSTGTLTVSFTTDTTPTNAVNIQANAVSSLTQTTLAIEYRVEIFGPTTTITPQ